VEWIVQLCYIAILSHCSGWR